MGPWAAPAVAGVWGEQTWGWAGCTGRWPAAAALPLTATTPGNQNRTLPLIPPTPPHPRCRRHVVTIDGYQDVPPNNAGALKQALANQPVSVAICANPALQFYSSGVFTEKACCQQLNHGVLAVGCVPGKRAAVCG